MTVTQITPTGPGPRMSERDLQTAITGLCRWLHLLCYHTHDSRHSAAGFPDLVIVGSRVLFRELKSDSGQMRKDQTVWADGLLEAGADMAVWRPADWRAGRIRQQLEAIMCTARARS
jgi:hypothetical protein